MSLLRPALVLGSAASYWVTFTAPVKSPPGKQSFNERVMAVWVNSLSIVPKVVCVTFAALEATSALSFYFPDQAVPELLHSIRGPQLLAPPSALFVAISIVGMLGGAIRIACYRALGQFFTFNLAIRDTQSLITSGPYSYVRHPSYMGATMSMFAGTALHLLPESWMQNSGLFTLPVVKVAMGIWMLHTCAVIMGCPGRMADEDRLLKKNFGKQWDDWATRVPYKLVPGIF